MADQAIVIELQRHVVGIVHSLKVRRMAPIACARSIPERPLVALIAGQRHVCPHQRVTGAVMIKGGRLPGAGRMAMGAGSVELSLQMIGIGRTFIGIPVTAVAFSRSIRKMSVGMALIA